MIIVIFILKEDITNRINYEIKDIERNNILCIKEYNENKCDPETRIPALEYFCNEKEKCFLRDSELEIGKTRTTITVLIEIINEIFEKLTWNSIFGLVIVYFCFIVSFSFIIHIGKSIK